MNYVCYTDMKQHIEKKYLHLFSIDETKASFSV